MAHPSPTYQLVITPITAAPVWRIVLACLVDFLLIAGCTGAIFLLFEAGHTELGLTIIIVLLASSGLILRPHLLLGQTPGWRVLNLRLSSNGQYPGIGIFKERGTKYVAADLSRGADPIMPVSTVAVLEPPPIPVASSAASRRPPPSPPPHLAAQVEQRAEDMIRTRRDAAGFKPPIPYKTLEPVLRDTIFAAHATPLWQLYLDGRLLGPVTGSIVFGRVPNPNAGGLTVTVMDLSLGVSRNHVRLSLTPEGDAQVEDLGSMNGTIITHANGVETALIPGKPHIIDEHETAHFSGHTIAVSQIWSDLK